ncbi:unnamed protein product [Echinostoma caproni]|uniref:SSD domain-containing protein n=1 Tax=Echinostoma caproni TaxID=27848 RepID=A0A183B230_9TREM|nr:unnamed protein product [Echinostoma caproni]
MERTSILKGSYMHSYNELISELLAQDTSWLGMGLTLLLFLLFLGTCNLWLPMLTLIGIGWSLLIAYAIYTQLFNIPQFPLINLMAIVLAIGLGADDLLVYFQIWTFSKHAVPILNSDSPDPASINTICQCSCVWKQQKREAQSQSSDSDDLVLPGRPSVSVSHPSAPSEPGPVNRLRFTLSHALPSMTLTTVSTILGLLVNLFSSIVAVKRFALFSTLVVASNLLFVLITAPLFFLLCDSCCANPDVYCCISPFHTSSSSRPGWALISAWFATIVQRGRWIISITFLIALTITCYLLFGARRFDLPQTGSQSASFLRPHHPFEMFINQQSNWFWTERELHHWENLIQFHIVWGLVPGDTRSFWTYSDADQYTTASWIPDSQLNLTSLASRQWLQWFCDTQLKQMPHLLHAKWFEHRPDSLSWFDPALLNRQIQLPIWCPVGHYPNSLDNYVFARACSLPKTHCCVNNTGLDTQNAPVDRYLNCLTEWLAYEAHQLPQEALSSGFRFSMSPNGIINEPVGLVLTVITNVAEYLPWSILSAILMASILMLITCRNLVLSLVSLLCLIGCLMIAVLLLALLDNWTLGVVEGLVLSLASGLAIDPCLHLAQTVSRLHKARGCCEPAGFGPVLHRALTMLNPAVTGSTWSTALAGLCMLSCQLLCYHQIGVFLATLMTCSWLICYVTFASNFACLDDLLRWWTRR